MAAQFLICAIFNLPKLNASPVYAPPDEDEAIGIRSIAKTVSGSQMHDRVFLGDDCWANPMEDWRVVDGAAQCVSLKGNRNVRLLMHQLTNVDGQFEISVVIDQVDTRKLDTGAGFKIGIRSDINPTRLSDFEAGSLGFQSL